jgi:hypothetical protein
MNHYEQKLEARRERLLARADRLREESSRRFQSARSRIEHIPPGQPILVGHHSEKRHRRDLARHDTDMRAGIDAQERAEEAARRAEGVGRAGISSDDPDAADKLAERIKVLEERQTMMTVVNKLLRRGDDAGILALGVRQSTLERLKTPDYMGRTGFASYELQNNGSNIRRLKARLAYVQRLQKQETVEVEIGDVRIVQNAEANRTQIFFRGKPEAMIRKTLKSYGFRWAPSEGAWQRHLSTQAQWAAEQVVKSMRDANGKNISDHPEGGARSLDGLP